MERYFFQNDYGEGAHPVVLKKLIETNLEHTCGYGLDEYSIKAAELIREKCGKPQAAVHMMTGGTSANMIALSSFMRPFEAAIAAETGHINVHETGTIEGSGHKVCIAASRDGKVLPQGVEAVVHGHTDEHMVHPRVLYISQPTEIGTVYSLDELKALRQVCDKHDLILFVDGARLGSALTCSEATATLKDLADLADCFYIGGTKNGLYFGEAMVIVNPALQKDFRFMIKNRGGMIAKGRLCGVMFLAALENDDYFAWARHANAMADKIREGMEEYGVPFFQKTTTNQVFPVVTKEQEKALAERFAFEHWGDVDETHSAIRFVTSWATKEEDVCALVEALKTL
ncbi:MAG: aminotransferase class I/II-fold pyridoxal phosphate-dependent enzyme [Clostridia bacterium]|nr:aminotransferase class I/II-fold pyridoxal phosphate-dependent enzyme [Clostridia bacterium]